MAVEDIDRFQNIMPHFTHVVHRVCSPAWRLRPLVLGKHNLILVYDGEAVVNCNGKEYKASKGHLISFKPGDKRYAETVPDNLMKCYAVDFVYSCPVFMDGGWSFQQVDLPFRTVEFIRNDYLFSRLVSLFDELTKIWLSDGRRRVIRSRAVFTEILCLLLEWKSGSDINYDKIRKVEKVIHYMADNYNRKLTLRQLADHINLSPAYLCSVFKDVSGKSPIEYLMEIRINRAKELIRDGHTISETAGRIGFNDISYFSKYFKKIEGVSPVQWLGKQLD